MKEDVHEATYIVRIVVCAAILVLIYFEKIQSSMIKYQKKVVQLLFLSLLIISIGLFFRKQKTFFLERLFYKIFEMINSFLNLSICYIMNDLLRNEQKSVNLLFYLASVVISLTILFGNTYKLTYIANFIISAYTLKLFQDLRKRSQFDPKIEGKLSSLICLEIMIFVLNGAIWIIDVVEHFSIFSLKLSIFIFYLLKIYVVVQTMNLNL